MFEHSPSGSCTTEFNTRCTSTGGNPTPERRQNVGKAPSGTSRGCLSFKIWPNREATIGILPAEKPSEDKGPLDFKVTHKTLSRVADHLEAIHYGIASDLPRCLWGVLFIDIEKVAHARELANYAILMNRKRGCRDEAPITLSDLLICHKNGTSLPKRAAKRRGSGGCTTYGRKSIRSGLEYFRRYYGKSRTSFCTVTIPQLSDEDLSHVLSNWRDIQRRFFQELNREQTRLGLCVGYVGATEIQPKRWEETGRPYPHIHFLCQSRHRPRGQYDLRVEWLRATWKRILETVLGKELLDIPRCEMAYPRKNLQHELSKYMSKADATIREIFESDWADKLPNSWHSLSKGIKEWIASNTYRFDGWQVSSLWDDVKKNPDRDKCNAIELKRRVTNQETGEIIEYLVGLYLSWPSPAQCKRHLRSVGIPVHKIYSPPHTTPIVRKGAVSRAA